MGLTRDSRKGGNHCWPWGLSCFQRLASGSQFILREFITNGSRPTSFGCRASAGSMKKAVWQFWKLRGPRFLASRIPLLGWPSTAIWLRAASFFRLSWDFFFWPSLWGVLSISLTALFLWPKFHARFVFSRMRLIWPSSSSMPIGYSDEPHKKRARHQKCLEQVPEIYSAVFLWPHACNQWQLKIPPRGCRMSVRRTPVSYKLKLG